MLLLLLAGVFNEYYGRVGFTSILHSFKEEHVVFYFLIGVIDFLLLPHYYLSSKGIQYSIF